MASIISIGLVVYRNSIKDLYKIFESIRSLNGAMVGVFDNSECGEELAEICKKYGWKYFASRKNIGFGAGHNFIFHELAGNVCHYHLLVNPDIEFNRQVITNMLAYMDAHQDIGLMMPDILNSDGSRQFLCKLLPTPVDLIARRFLPNFAWKIRSQARYELRDWNHNDIRDIPSLSGCFMLLRGDAFKSVGGFDERFFLYMEDFDLCRRIGEKWRTVFYPHAKVTHGYAKGSYKSMKLLLLHIQSAIKYFNKWGWFFDAYRKKRNRECMRDLGLLE